MVEVEFAIDLSLARQASVAPSLIRAPARQLFVATATAPSLAARAKEMVRQGYIKGNEIMATLTSNSCASKKWHILPNLNPRQWIPDSSKWMPDSLHHAPLNPLVKRATMALDQKELAEQQIK